MQNSDFTTGEVAGPVLQADRKRAAGRTSGHGPMLYWLLIIY
jgi:hypothetical protein